MALSPQLRDTFNKDIATWAKNTRQKLLFRIASLNLESKAALLQRIREKEGRTKPLAKSVKSYVKKEFGQAEIVRFSFWLHGWFFDRGVGKGTPISQAGQGKRIAKPWIDYVLDDEVQLLADMIVEIYGDDIVDELKLRA